MDILDTQPTISKWEQLSDGKEFRTPYSAAETNFKTVTVPRKI